MSAISRRMPVGAELHEAGGVHFRVWAPACRQVEVVLEDEGGVFPLEAEPKGYFAGRVSQAGSGTLYRYRLDGDGPYPDPASRFQPEGPHGPSRVEDPGRYRWGDDAWGGISHEGQVLYELHVGTFTREGSWAAAAAQLPALADLGVTVLEVMPVADFVGGFGWGYDGVNLFAPTRLYGTPDDFRAFVDAAHRVGLGVILDVVYNHLGPDGNYLARFAPAYFTHDYPTDWGDAINFHGPGSDAVREFYLGNAAYWIREFHLDGLRLDATQNVYDVADGADHILAAVTARSRAAAGSRPIYVIAENEPQHARLVRPRKLGGYGMDALWNDDFHHSATVALTGRAEAYYSDYLGTPQELISASRWGFLFQGQRYHWQHLQPRGTPALDLPASRFVHFIQNHDQVANSAAGARIHQLAGPGRLRAITALLLLGPATPLLFQGQEFAASAPFLYFADQPPDLAEKVREGRREFLRQFPGLAQPDVQAGIADPSDPATFARCKLDHGERERHARAYALHRDLLRLRREDAVLRAQRSDRLHGAVLSEEAFLLRYLGEEGEDRLLVVNLGRDLHLDPAPEPLLAPPEGRAWRILWSSEDAAYGGSGTAPVDTEENWRIPGNAAVVLAPTTLEEK